MKLGIYSLVISLVFVSCVSSHKTADRDLASLFEKQAESFADESRARSFDKKSVEQLSSSRAMKFSEARLILDNDAAFDSKISLIRSAQKEIRMVYYIYSLDHSSAVLTQELVKKAASGVKVKLLVDLITNFGNMDLFKWMEKEGRGNLKVYFYNFPTGQIQADAVYLTLPCPIVAKPSPYDCANHKAKVMAKMGPQNSTVFSRMLLAGLYGKNATALKVAMGIGAGIDPANYKNGASDEQAQAQLLEFLEIVKDAYFKNDFTAKIKLWIALSTYGESLNPVMNEITGRLPIRNAAGTAERQAQEWDHITDYTHHKLLAVDESAFQLGGRNIEDSYHVKSRLGKTGKYIFIDTDFYVKGSIGQTADVERAFDKLLSIKGMIASIPTIDKLMAADFVKNPDALTAATGLCVQEEAADIGSCIQSKITKMPTYKPEDQRLADLTNQIRMYESEYNQKYVKKYRDTWKEGSFDVSGDRLSPQDLQTSQFYYLENLPFSKKDSAPRRNLGARIGIESKYSKNIHAAWYRGLENACRVSHNEKKETRVIFNNAYVFMPAGLVYRLAKMINGDYGDCSRVKITFLTNSFETTDLNIINIFARYQIKEIFQHYQKVKENFEITQKNVAPRKIYRPFPTIEYFEYNKSALAEGISLHTKLTLLGNDMIVGSANADARSYFMDSNNAILIRNAKNLNADYAKYVDRLTGNSSATSSMNRYFSTLTPERIQAENVQILKAALDKFDKKGRVKENHQKRILGEVAELGARISTDTAKILDFRRATENASFENPGAVSDVEKELNETANRFDDFFKLL